MSKYLQPEEDGLPMQEYGPWTAEKLDYLARYIDVFETAMRQQWHIRYYIDLLAGSGKNRVEGSGAVLLGSALLALTTKYPFTGYYFIDRSEDNTLALRQRCADSPNFQQVNIHTVTVTFLSMTSLLKSGSTIGARLIWHFSIRKDWS